MTEPRVIRVFISSTFRDMQGERDELVKRVFPELRRVCEARGVVWGEIDLRWGVTDEQAAEDAVLPICLAEIDRTRPYFVGLLGDRYGWVPDAISGELVNREAWLRDDRGRSVTELEILHGVLNAPHAVAHAFFYLRDPAWARSQPHADQATYLEATAAGRDRLDSLKARIMASGVPSRSYASPTAVGEAVRADLLALIDRLYPLETAPDLLERERRDQATFARRQMDKAVARPGLTTRLAVALESGPGAVVSAAPGGGVSTLLADFVAQHRLAHPDHRVLVHHIEADGRGASEAALLQHWLGELGVAEAALPSDVSELRRQFTVQLARAAAEQPVVLVADGLHLLGGEAGLAFLPARLPAGVKILAGARPGVALAQLVQRGLPRIDLPALDDAERGAATVEFLRHFAKALDKPLIDRIAAVSACGNARHLRTLLDELRQHGDHFTLGARLGTLLTAPDLPGLVGVVLQRLATDFESEHDDLVARVLGWLAVAQTGLTEAELLDLLGDGAVPAARRPLSALLFAADNLLTDTGGKIRFAFAEVADQVLRRFAPDAHDRKDLHAQVAQAFVAHPCSPRGLDELPWQLLGAGRHDALAAILTDTDFVVAAHERDASLLARLWACLQAESPHRVTEVVGLCNHAPASRAASVVLPILAAAGHVAEVATLRHAAVDALRGADPKGNLNAALANLAAALLPAGDLRGALAILDELESRLQDHEPAQIRLALWQNRGAVRRSLGETAGAVTDLLQAECLALELNAPADVQAAAGERAAAMAESGDLPGALQANEVQVAAATASGDGMARMRALATRATLLLMAGHTRPAAPLAAEAEALARDYGDLEWLAQALMAKASCLQAGGHASAAASALLELAEIRSRLGQHDIAREIAAHARSLQQAAPAPTTQSRQLDFEQDALRRMGLGDHRGALDVLHAQQELLQDATAPQALAACLGNQAVCLHFLGEHAQVPALLEQQVVLCRQVGEPLALAIALANRGEAMARGGDLGAAEDLLREAGEWALQMHHAPLVAGIAQILETIRRSRV